jgi:hypothetical protein
MNDRERILTSLSEVFNRWEELLDSLPEAQIIAAQLPSDPVYPTPMSIKDVIAHLHAWQQVSIARLEAARLGAQPILPGWLEGADPESEEEIEQFNARIYAANHALPWPQVYQTWRDGFLHFLELAEQVPEDELMDRQRYPWLNGYALFAVLEGLYEHHRIDHLEPLLAWLRQR